MRYFFQYTISMPSNIHFCRYSICLRQFFKIPKTTSSLICMKTQKCSKVNTKYSPHVFSAFFVPLVHAYLRILIASTYKKFDLSEDNSSKFLLSINWTLHFEHLARWYRPSLRVLREWRTIL